MTKRWITLSNWGALQIPTDDEPLMLTFEGRVFGDLEGKYSDGIQLAGKVFRALEVVPNGENHVAYLFDHETNSRIGFFGPVTMSLP